MGRNNKVHGLRCEARYFDDVVSGTCFIQTTISYILGDERYCKDGYVILGLSKIKKLIGTEKESVG